MFCTVKVLDDSDLPVSADRSGGHAIIVGVPVTVCTLLSHN